MWLRRRDGPVCVQAGGREATPGSWARLTNRPAFICFDHEGKRRNFQRARLQSSSAAPPVKRFSVVQLRVLRDFCMLICCGGGETREGCFSKEHFEACQKCTRMHGEMKIYRSNCSVSGRDETMNKFLSYDLEV